MIFTPLEMELFEFDPAKRQADFLTGFNPVRNPERFALEVSADNRRSVWEFCFQKWVKRPTIPRGGIFLTG